MRYATAEHISELFKFHVACGQVASALASSLADHTWSLSLAANGTGGSQCSCRECLVPDFVNQTSIGESGFRNCNAEDYDKEFSGPFCVWNYFHRSALVLAHHPTPEAVTTRAFVLLQAGDCTCTRAMALRAVMIELSFSSGRAIKHAIERVSLVVLLYHCPCLYIMMAGSLTQGCFRETGSE